MSDDAQLLRRYVETRSEAAFAELAQRHLALVYHAAMRRVGSDPQLAEEITQMVFILLAEKARSLLAHTSLVGWLYTTTQFKAARAARTELRRRLREQEAFLLNAVAEETTGAEWERVRPVIDDALMDLAASDREAVLLRFFQERSFAEIAERLRLTENTAHKRVERALDKLRECLSRRGIRSPTAALAAALATQAGIAAPAGLAPAVIGAAVASGAGAAGVVGGLSLLNLKLAAGVTAVSALIAIGAALYEIRLQRTAAADLALARIEAATADARLLALTRRTELQTQKNAALAAELERAKATWASLPASIPADQPTPTEEGDKFMAAHPEAQKLVDTVGRALFRRNSVPRLREIGVSPAEIDDLIAMAGDSIAQIGLGSVVLQVKNNANWDRLLADKLGPERYQRFLEARRGQFGRAITQNLAIATYDSEQPLTPEQAAAVVRSLNAHTRWSSADDATPEAVDWPAIMQQLRPMLSGSQLATLENIHLVGMSESDLAAATPSSSSAGAAKGERNP